MSTVHLFDSAFCVHLTWALLHFVWQGALIVGGSILAVWLLGRDSPQRRHRIYLTAMLLMPLCLPVTLGVVVGWDADRGLPAAGADALASWPTEIGPEVAPPDEIRRPSEVVARPEPRADSSEVAVAPRGIAGEAWARWTALGYVLGVALMLSRVLLAVQGGRRLRRVTSPVREPDLLAAIRTQVERFGLRIAPSVSWCDRVLVPVVIGLGKPAILLPTSLVTGLTPAQLSLVIAHEMAHLYRWDHIVLVVQRVVEAVLFFHPAVWYVSRRLSVERELCCDELVLRAGGDTHEYAESLIRVVELTRPAARPAPMVAVAMVPGRQGSRALVERLSRILGQTECSPVRLTSPWPLALGLVLSLVAALVLGLAGSLSALAQSDSATANTSLANGNEADQTAGESVDEQHAVAALRAMRVVKSGDLNTTPLRTAEFWSVPTKAWPHIGRLLSLHELRIVASDVRAEPFEHIGRLKNLRRLTVINSKCSPTDLTQVKGLANLEYLEVVFTVLEESDAWRSKQLGQLTPVEQEQVDRYLASRPTAQAEQYRQMMEVAVLTDRALQHLGGLKQLRTLKLINTNITGHGLDCLKDLPALEELDLPLIAFSPDVARVLGGMQSLRRFRYADVTDESLAEFARLSGLEELELFGDSVTDRGAEHLKRLVELRKLSIRGSRFTDQGLQQLAGLPHLEYLDVRHSVGSLSAAGVTQFQTQKPGCQVLFEPAAKQGDPPPVNPAAVPQDKGANDAAKKTVGLAVRINATDAKAGNLVLDAAEEMPLPPPAAVPPEPAKTDDSEKANAALRLSPQEEAKVSELLRKLEAGNAETQKKAIMELANRYGPKARPAVPGLTKLLQSRDKELGILAAVALARIAPETNGLESILREALQGDDVRMRGGAVFGLAFLGPRDPTTVAPLIKTLEDENADVAEAAAAALGQMGKPAVTPLVEALDSPKKNVRQLAAQAVGQIGAPAQDAVPELIKLLQDREGRVCDAAAKALGSFAPERKEAIPHLLATMKVYGSNYIATSAAQSLGKFGPQVVPSLRELLRDDRSEAGYAVKWALEAMGRQAVTEGAVLYVFPDGKLSVWLGGEGALKVGDLLHVQRQAANGSRQSVAVVVVKAAEGAMATCLVLQVRGPANVPIGKGDVVSRWQPEPTDGRSEVSKPTMEGVVLAVSPAQEVNISLGFDDGLTMGDTLHVRRQAPDGSSRSLAVIAVKSTERATASCAVLHELADPPPHLPVDKGDIAARWCPVGKVLSVQGEKVEISLGKNARLTRGERIFVSRNATSTPAVIDQVTEITVETIGDNSTVCTVRPGGKQGEKMPIRVGDWAIPHRTEFLNLDYGAVEERSADGSATVDQAKVPVFVVFYLQYATAGEVAKELTLRSAPEGEYRFMPDSRRNALVVYATQDLQEKLETAIRALDVPAAQRKEG